MAKTFLEFEGKIINVPEIRYIEPLNRWNSKTSQMEYHIEINRPTDNMIIPQQRFTFTYHDADVRDSKMSLIKMLLEGLDYVEFIGG